MQDLRLVGVHEGGEHLLLVGENGEHYRLPLDEPLRAAARRDRPRLGQLQIEMDAGMRPRDVQSLIRAGASAEEVADRSGWSVEKVRKYEGPIAAERAHVADQARQVRVRTRGGAGSGAPTLQGRVGQRMLERGVDAATNAWDAYRTPEARNWTVVLTFAAGGRQRQAAWTYDPVLRTVEAGDDEARWLSADEPAHAGPVPSSPARSASVYDVEAEGGVAATVRRSGSSVAPSAAAGQAGEPVDLMTAMRQRTTVGRRSGRRRSGSVEPVRPEPQEDTVLPLEPAESAESVGAGEGPGEVPVEPAGTEAPPLDEPDEPDEPGHADHEEALLAGDEPAAIEDPSAEAARVGPAEALEPVDAQAGPEPPDGAHEAEQPADVATPPAPKRKGRTQVPSWDDIMFGAKRD